MTVRRVCLGRRPCRRALPRSSSSTQSSKARAASRASPGVLAVAVSPDGRNVYAIGTERRRGRGVHARGGAGSSDQLEVQKDGVGKRRRHRQRLAAIAISPDGGFVYVAGSRDDAVAAFARDTAPARSRFSKRKKRAPRVSKGIRYARALAISPDGEYLYAAGQKSDAIAVFKRNTLTGWLTFVEVQHQGVLGVAGIAEPLALTMSPTVRTSTSRAATRAWSRCSRGTRRRAISTLASARCRARSGLIGIPR